MSSIFKYINITGAVTSALSLFLLYVFVIYAHSQLGRWPQPMNPDPKDLAYAMYFMLPVFYMHIVALVLFPISVAYRIYEFAKLPEKPPSNGWYILLPSLALALSWFIDPWESWYWFYD